MPLPSFTVTGDLNDILGNISGGELVADTFVCSDHRRYATGRLVPNLEVGPNGQYFVSWEDALHRVGPIEFQITESGISRGGDPIKCLANDPGLSVTGLQWTVEIPGMEPFTFNAPLDGGTIDLGTVAPAVQVETTVNTLTAIQDAVDASFANFFIDLDEWDTYATFEDFPATGTTGVVYVATTSSAGASAGQLFVWNGSAYVPASQDIAPRTHAAPIKASPVEDDEVPLVDSESSNTLARLPLKNLQVMYRRARSFDDTNGVDDYAVVQAALAEGAGEYVVRKGNTLLIAPPGGGIMLTPQSNTRLIIEEGATIQVKTNALDLYYLLQLNGVQNVTIENDGVLLGDALTHTGSTGQYGHLVNITNGCANIRLIGGGKVKEAWGDGVYVGGGSTSVNYDILIDGWIADDCRREAFSPFWVDGMTIRNYRINGGPAALIEPVLGNGIDCEPNDDQWVTDLTIEQGEIRGLIGNGIYTSPLPISGAPYITNLIIRDNIIVGCGTAPTVAGHSNGIYVREVDDAKILNNVVRDSGFASDTTGLSANIKVNLCDRTVIQGGHVSGATGSGILVTGGTQPEISGVTSQGNDFRGINTSSPGAVIVGNHVFDNDQAGGAGEHHVAVSGDNCVVAHNVFRGSNGSSWVRVSSGNDNMVAFNTGLGTSPTNKFSDAGTNTRRGFNFRIDTGVYEAWDVTGGVPLGTVELGHATDTTFARTAAGRAAIEGAEIITATAAAAVDAKTTPVDADLFTYFDSETSNVPKRWTWANIKTALQSWLGLLPLGTAVAIHNQADQVTNYERARHHWASDIYTIATESGGTGTPRQILIQAGGAGSISAFAATQNATVGTTRLRANLSAANGTIAGVNGTLSASSGVQYGLSVSPTINQSGTAGYDGLLINVTETATGSGAKKPLDVQIGGVTKFAIDNTGTVTLTDAANIAAGTTTGTKIGTATSQKLGFWNATPIVQPTTAVAAATFAANTSGIANDTATFDGYTIGQVVKALRNAGLLA